MARQERVAGEKAARKRKRELAKGGGVGNDRDTGDEDGEEEDDDEEEGFGALAEGVSMEDILKNAQDPAARERVKRILERGNYRGFHLWMKELHFGWSVLLYGVGSKLEVLECFEDWVAQNDELGCVVAYDGFAPDASGRHLLDNLCAAVLGRKNMDLSSPNLRTYAQRFVEAFSELNDPSGHNDQRNRNDRYEFRQTQQPQQQLQQQQQQQQVLNRNKTIVGAHCSAAETAVTVDGSDNDHANDHEDSEEQPQQQQQQGPREKTTGHLSGLGGASGLGVEGDVHEEGGLRPVGLGSRRRVSFGARRGTGDDHHGGVDYSLVHRRKAPRRRLYLIVSNIDGEKVRK